MRYLATTQAHTATCESHIAENALQGTPIEAFLAQYLLVILSAEVQQEIYTIVREYAMSAFPEPLRNFVPDAAERLLRSVKSSEIAGLLGTFGAATKARFTAQLSERVVTIYNNAIAQRHEIAHYSGTSISFADLKAAILCAEEIIEAARVALPTQPSEISA